MAPSMASVSRTVHDASAFDPSQRLRVSPYACIRQCADGLRIESLMTGRSFLVPNPTFLGLLFALSRPTAAAELLDRVPESVRPALAGFLRRCTTEGILTRVNQDGNAADESESLAHWEFADLL